MTCAPPASASSLRIPASNPLVRAGLALVLSWAAALAAQAPGVQASVDAHGIQRVTIVGGSYFFRPARVTAKAGQPLDLTVSMEEGIVPHRFVLEDPGGKPVADIELAAAPKTLRLVLAPGDYPFTCPNRLLMFKSHRERGMSGMLEIRE
ncbi:cupredoxin domain-containing protein [Aromatoleum evansii]|uniref:cupredoxin domain-containing protein n=1 Tax=Aromatoleum evansii TaxID=59406 RepID=UPI001FE6F51E|nr:cupredoxin domain-containing protein [Aromatoleum evansii]